ncbi:MAG: hypothetical protein HDS16_04460 [Bacteroides sp.]|nr:hypothetical protein [Bacteroides sp.]
MTDLLTLRVHDWQGVLGSSPSGTTSAGLLYAVRLFLLLSEHLTLRVHDWQGVLGSTQVGPLKQHSKVIKASIINIIEALSRLGGLDIGEE